MCVWGGGGWQGWGKSRLLGNWHHWIIPNKGLWSAMPKCTNVSPATVPPSGKQSLPRNLKEFVLLHVFPPVVAEQLIKFRGSLHFKAVFLNVDVLFL